MQRMMADQKRKADEKIKELQSFIARFSANKSKSKQATSRRKLLDKLTVEELPASSRRIPLCRLQAMDREIGKEVADGRPHQQDGGRGEGAQRRLLHASAKGGQDRLYRRQRAWRLTTLLQILGRGAGTGFRLRSSGASAPPAPTSQRTIPPYFNGCDLIDSAVALAVLHGRSPRPICAAFWAGCSSPATMSTSRCRCSPAEKRCAACSRG